MAVLDKAKTIDLIAGARPNFMKIAAVIAAMKRASERDGFSLKYRLVHTGQHYDPKMSGAFFDQLGIPQPDVNLEVGSGTHAQQTAGIMTKYEALLMEAPSDVCLVVGDVTSTMACAIAAQKLWIPVAHVEGGIRSGDWGMPEEINRMVTDAITNWFFTTSEVANQNLRASGVSEDRIFFVGNTMIDTLLANLQRIREPEFVAEHGLEEGAYFTVTLHRPSNVDQLEGFADLLRSISEATRGMPVVFPVHPRTAKTLRQLGDLPENLILVDPQGYLEFIHLVKHAKAVITDSGGITEEATVLGVPCVTLRDSTERPETVDIGTNELIGTDPSRLKPTLDKLFAGEWKQGAVPPLWDGKTGDRIVSALEQLLSKQPVTA